MNKSLEQIAEEYSREIREKRRKILEDFYIAYVAQLSEFENFDLQNLCIVEQQFFNKNGITTKFWIEKKPVFDD